MIVVVPTKMHNEQISTITKTQWLLLWWSFMLWPSIIVAIATDYVISSLFQQTIVAIATKLYVRFYNDNYRGPKKNLRIFICLSMKKSILTYSWQYLWKFWSICVISPNRQTFYVIFILLFYCCHIGWFTKPPASPWRTDVTETFTFNETMNDENNHVKWGNYVCESGRKMEELTLESTPGTGIPWWCKARSGKRET